MFDYAGCIHFHSSYSYDAQTPMAVIIQAGLRAGLDYAIVTDHFQLGARADGWERYHSDAQADRRLLMLVGEEISPRYNHFIALGLESPLVAWKNQSQAQRVIDDVSAAGGFGFLAHPDHEGAPLLGSRAFPWIDWNVKNFAGLSIWDLMSDWSAALRSPWSMLCAAFWPAHALAGPRRKTLARWDGLTQEGHVVAIGETDNHGRVKRMFGIKRHLFPFDFAFRTVRTHLLLPQALTGDAAADQKRIFQALRQGESYVSLDFWQDPKGFMFEAFDRENRASVGGVLERRGAALIESKIPSEGRFRLIRNGDIIFEERKRPHFERDLDLPGVYRVEVDQYAAGRWRPWIFSNPIWVK